MALHYGHHASFSISHRPVTTAGRPNATVRHGPTRQPLDRVSTRAFSTRFARPARLRLQRLGRLLLVAAARPHRRAATERPGRRVRDLAALLPATSDRR